MTVYSVILIIVQQRVAIGPLSLHGFVVVYGAGALIDYIDPGTALGERSSCLLFIDRLLPTVDLLTRCSRTDQQYDRTHCTLQLSVPLPVT